MKLYDLLKIFAPKTRIRLKIEFPKNSLVYEDSLSDFIKSRYYRIFCNEIVKFEGLSGGFMDGFIAEISVNGVLPDDI